MDAQLIAYAHDLLQAGKTQEEIARELVARGADVSEAARLVEGWTPRTPLGVALVTVRYAVCLTLMVVSVVVCTAGAIAVPFNPVGRLSVFAFGLILAMVLWQIAKGTLFEWLAKTYGDKQDDE